MKKQVKNRRKTVVGFALTVSCLLSLIASSNGSPQTNQSSSASQIEAGHNTSSGPPMQLRTNASSMIVVHQTAPAAAAAGSNATTPMTNMSLMAAAAAAAPEHHGKQAASMQAKLAQSTQATSSNSSGGKQSPPKSSHSQQQQQLQLSGGQAQSPALRLKQQAAAAAAAGAPRQPSHQHRMGDTQMAADDTQQEAFMTIQSGPIGADLPQPKRPSMAGNDDNQAAAPARPKQPKHSLADDSRATASQAASVKGHATIAGGRASSWPQSGGASGWKSAASPRASPISSAHRHQQLNQQQIDLAIQQQQQRFISQQLDQALVDPSAAQPIESAQLERPSGYSYGEPAAGSQQQPMTGGGGGGGYTHTSQISPARQELMQATTSSIEQQRQRQRQPSSSYQTSSYQTSYQQSYQPGGRQQSYEPLMRSIGQFNDIEQQHQQQQLVAIPASKSASQLPQFNTITQRPLDSNYQQQQQPAPTLGLAQPSNPCRPGSFAAGGGGGGGQLEQSQLAQNSIGLEQPGIGPAKYQRAGDGTRLRSPYIFKVIRADSLTDCELACSSAAAANNPPSDACRSFNYRAYFAAENCELSRHELRSLRLDDGAQFEQHTQFDFYALEQPSAAAAAALMLAAGSSPLGVDQAAADCLDVSQSCTPDGMEFTLRTAEPFNGRIYTYGFYDSCFADGRGSTSSQLRISRSNGFPRCGTQQFGDLMTNIVVVQFNDYVQTTRDKKYNLTCYFSGPGEAVVTSNYLDTKIDERSHPIQIEHLPPQNVVTSNVHLRVLYRGQPTNTIAVGDLLTFRLETRSLLSQQHQQQQHRAIGGESGGGAAAGHSQTAHNEIFATNVIAKDPYSGRQVQLIDSRGCPIDPVNVFPELQRTPDGALESEFYAFKIPDSNFLIFQATVRTCKAPCEPVICQASGHPLKGQSQAQPLFSPTKGSYLMAGSPHSGVSSVPSWGKRRRRRRRSADYGEDDELLSAGESVEHVIPARLATAGLNRAASGEMEQPDELRWRPPAVHTIRRPELADAEEEVKEMFRVFMSRAELSKQQRERQHGPTMAAGQEEQQQQLTHKYTTATAKPSNSNHSQAADGDDDAAAAAGGGGASSQSPLLLLRLPPPPPINESGEPNVCMSQSSYYVMLFTVISLSLILLSIAAVSMYVTNRTKLRISDSIADSMY